MQINLKRMRRDIEDVGPRSVRLDAVNAAIRSVAAEHRELRVLIEEAMAALADEQATRPAYGALARDDMKRSLGWLAGGLTVADVAAQYAVFTTQIGGLSAWQWALIAPAVTALLAVGTHGAAAAWTFDPARREAGIRRNFWGAGITGAVTAGALSVLMFSRTMTPAMVPTVLPIARSSLWVVAELMPICAGFLSVALRLLNLESRAQRALRKMQARLDDLQHFHTWLVEEQRRLNSPPAPSSPPVPAMLMLALALVTGAQMASAAAPQAPVSAQATMGAASAAPVAAAWPMMRVNVETERPASGGCLVRADESDSLNPMARRSAVEAIRDRVIEVVTMLNCRSLSFGWFAEDGGPFAYSQEWIVPQPLSRPCRPTPPLVDTRGFGPLRSVQEYEQLETSQACARQRDDDRREYESRRAAFTANVTRAIQVPEKGRVTCTALASMISYLLAVATGPVIILSDFEDNCSVKQDLPRRRGVPVYLIVVPKRGPLGKEGWAAMARAERWQRRIANAHIVPYPDVTSTFSADVK
jgi:hypothetical protein